MPTHYHYVDGDRLAALTLEVRHEFLSRPPCTAEEAGRPNSLRLTALEVVEDRPSGERLAILAEVIDCKPGFVLNRDRRAIFEYADTPAAYVMDLVCEIVCQILTRDPRIREEDARRKAVAVDAADEPGE